MQNFDQIIVGAGASGLTFLHSALQGTQQKFVRKKTLVVGKGADQLCPDWRPKSHARNGPAGIALAAFRPACPAERRPNENHDRGS